MDQVERGEVILNRFFIRNVLVLADVHADNAFPVQLRKAFSYRLGSIVVESQPVDQRPVTGQAEHPRLLVSWLGPKGYGPDLDEAKAERRELVHDPSILVKTCRDTDRILKLQPELFDLIRKLITIAFISYSPCGLAAQAIVKKAHRGFVCDLGVNAE